MCSREDDPTQHVIDTRRVLRPGTCKHPYISDRAVLAYHDTASGLRMPLDCTVVRHRDVRTGPNREYVQRLKWTCGQWYTVENLDGDIVMVDEPAGAGA